MDEATDRLPGFTLALCDTTSRDGAIARQPGMDVAIFVGAMAALAVVVRILSKWALSPVERAWDQQRRFISDASHELKTPLAVICANSRVHRAGRLHSRGQPQVGGNHGRGGQPHEEAGGGPSHSGARRRGSRGNFTEDALRHDEVDLSSLVDEAALEFDARGLRAGAAR